jgi:hypothetical protein
MIRLSRPNPQPSLESAVRRFAQFDNHGNQLVPSGSLPQMVIDHHGAAASDHAPHPPGFQVRRHDFVFAGFSGMLTQAGCQPAAAAAEPAAHARDTASGAFVSRV